MRPLCLYLLLVATAATPVRPQEPGTTGLDPGWTTERRSWSGRLGAGKGEGLRLRVVNEFGDIRIRSTDDDGLDASAVVQRRQDVEDELELAAVETPGEVLIETRFPDAVIDKELIAPGRRPDRRVDLVVFVPAGVEIDARTVRGLVEAKGMTAGARLRSESGDITAVTTASLDARTEPPPGGG